MKVDAKTRKDLLKYVTKKKRERDNETADEHTVSMCGEIKLCWYFVELLLEKLTHSHLPTY